MPLTPEIIREIEQNMMLRKEIVNLADFWDGKESIKYGIRLQKILDKLDIHDVPECYTEEYFQKIMKKLDETKAGESE